MEGDIVDFALKRASKALGEELVVGDDCDVVVFVHSSIGVFVTITWMLVAACTCCSRL